jgi:hypothetical protein
MTAARAETVKFEAVGLDRKAVTGSNLFLKALDVAVFELHDLSAAGANEVVVVTFVGDVVVLGLGAEVPGLGQAGFAKEIERPINCRQSQMRIFSRQLMIHLLRRDVLLLEKRIEDQFALAGELQLMLPEVLFQHLHLFRMSGHCV